MKSLVCLGALAAALAAAPACATPVTYDLAWTGAGGYSMSGSFTFDTATIGGDDLITQADLTAFSISFFDPTSSLLKTYSAVADAQVFAFHTDSLLIDQGPTINFIVGQLSPTDYLLLRGNGCTGDNMLLYQGIGNCRAPDLLLDRAGQVTASPANAVSAPTPLSLLAASLLGLALLGKRRSAA